MQRRQFLGLTATIAAAPLIEGCGESHTISIDQRLPIGPFGADSTAEEVTEGLDLAGRTALVTGCNSGIGYECMRVLALRGAHVIGTGRTLEKAIAACDSVTGDTTALALELSDFQSAVDCASRVAELGRGLDMLILNAGIGSFSDFELINGIEKIFVINYLGHVVLAENLLGLLAERPGSRIVHVGSQQGYRAAPPQGIDFDNLRGEKEHSGSAAYGRSKLGNALYSLKLSQRLDPAITTSNCVHPGFVKTNIGRDASGPLRWLYRGAQSLLAKSVQQGAATQTYVATAPALIGVSGAYFEDCNPVAIEGPNHVFDLPLADRLWDETQPMLQGYI
jgi:NAD(P)-dependent dehydrogenase (short-subunit alcohol dehydrogenase family)